MKHKHYTSTLLLLTLAMVLSPVAASAAERDATFVLRPACTFDLNKKETVFGPIPDVEGYVTLADDNCPSFHVEDPQTLRTNPLRIGDTLSIDIIIENPSAQSVEYFRSWLSYDPNILEGVSVVVHDVFPLVTPGESGFDVRDGYVMIEASNENENANTDKYIRAATITFRVLATSPAGSPLTFYDVQTGGHTSVTTTDNGADFELLSELPGSLKVVFAEAETDTTANETGNEDTTDGTQNNTTEDENFDSLFDTTNTDETTMEDNENAMQEDATSPSTTSETPSRTAFSLLQVRNLRLTTDGSSLYIGWDALNHQDLKAYNIYYGTTSGRYIQRKTIGKDMTSLILRSLPVGTTYYVAIRAVSTADEESAFSPEASVEIGNPNSSTSPLIIGSIPTGPNGVNPVQGSVVDTGAVPGETGMSSSIAWFVVISAITGTALALRRQGRVVTSLSQTV